MRVLIYKRTHTGDPDEMGCFGCRRCMASVRAWDFGAVIGVGGIGAEAVGEGIDRKITWIGIGPKEVGVASDGYPILAFEQFYLKDEKGPLLSDRAPKLARLLFKTYAPRRLVIDSELSDEIRALLKLARNAPPSPAILGQDPKPKRCKDFVKNVKKSC